MKIILVVAVVLLVVVYATESVGANIAELKEAIKVTGCPPKTRNVLITFMNHTVGKRRALRIMILRLFKIIAFKLGIYNEDFGIFNRYESPEFNKEHF